MTRRREMLPITSLIYLHMEGLCARKSSPSLLPMKRQHQSVFSLLTLLFNLHLNVTLLLLADLTLKDFLARQIRIQLQRNCVK